jgi:hypothetical protein
MRRRLKRGLCAHVRRRDIVSCTGALVEQLAPASAMACARLAANSSL